jgi:prepilin-type N-terminal cleavage/methylation domain-containing protein
MAENDDTRTTTRQREAGYSLIEIMIVVCMVGIISAMAVPVSSTFLVQRKADSAIVSTLAAVNAARDRAVAEQDFSLDNGQVFVKFGPVPDTPDAFGAATYASFTGTEPVMFTSDGSLLDSNGDITNGSIFVGFAGQKETARAVTIFGVTGLTRAWKWRGTKWME